MKKLNKKAALILGTVVLALGAFTIPALADTTNQNPAGINGMQSFMTSGAMQNVHNSTAMQDAMTTGDVSKMVNAMNTPEIKSIMGEDLVNQMTQYMKNGNFQAMRNGQGAMMGGSTVNNMMGSFTSQQ